MYRLRSWQRRAFSNKGGVVLCCQVTASEDYDGEHADYTLSVPPLQAEYDVIQTVIDKIDVRPNSHHPALLFFEF